MFVKCSESRFNSKKTFFDFGSRARETFFWRSDGFEDKMEITTKAG